jgi:hypothetical protein
MRFSITRLDGRESFFSLKHRARGAITSSLHGDAVSLIEELWPMCSYYEEVIIQISSRRKVRFDIFIPRFNLFVEVQGEQHTKFNSHFYKSKEDFKEALKRDAEKAEFCSLNNFDLIELKYNEKEKWKQQLLRT